ncbi:MAG TPA: transcriptional regulator [Streptomyces sp.]|nr:transcriptional regulator [Streptomyces sp.]
MPPRSAPTVRQQRLGAELRRLRERAGLSSTEAGALLGADQARISNIEAGRIGISPARLRTLACNYDCADEALVNALCMMASERGRHWWEEYRGILPTALLDLAEFEHHAVRLRTAQTSHVPGLLQTVDHARVVFQQGVPPLPPHEVEHRLSLRLKRQAVFHGNEPTLYTAVVHEAALHMQFGGEAVARAQLEHIIEMSERDNITVLVIPFRAGAFPGAGQSFGFAEGAVPQLDTVQLDASHGSVLLYAEAQLEKYRKLLARLEAIASGPESSRDLIHKVARKL